MAFQGARMVGRVRGWFGLIVLALCLSALGARAQGCPAAPAAARFALPLPGPNANLEKVKPRQGASLSHGAVQPQWSEGETGENGSGSDLIPARPVLLPSPGTPGTMGGHRQPGPTLHPGCQAGDNRPRPPPGH
jgi:hypothetical protein